MYFPSLTEKQPVDQGQGNNAWLVLLHSLVLALVFVKLLFFFLIGEFLSFLLACFCFGFCFFLFVFVIYTWTTHKFRTILCFEIGPPVVPGLASNSKSCCLSLLSAGIRGTRHHGWPHIFNKVELSSTLIPAKAQWLS